MDQQQATRNFNPPCQPWRLPPDFRLESLKIDPTCQQSLRDFPKAGEGERVANIPFVLPNVLGVTKLLNRTATLEGNCSCNRMVCSLRTGLSSLPIFLYNL